MYFPTYPLLLDKQYDFQNLKLICGPHIFPHVFPLEWRDTLFILKNDFKKFLESPLIFFFFKEKNKIRKKN